MAFIIYKDDFGDEFGVEYHFEGVHIRQTLEHPAEYPDLIIDSFYKLDDNGSRLCDGGEIEAEMLNLLLMFNQGTNVCFSTKSPLLQNRCYVPLFIEL